MSYVIKNRPNVKYLSCMGVLISLLMPIVVNLKAKC